jgi:transcriptional regulator with XRE-family HTH domain
MSGDEDERLLAAIERMDLIKTFGQRVRALREEQGISSDELARRCRVHSSLLSRIELGQSEPGLLMFLIVAEGLELSPTDLLLPIKAPIKRAPRHFAQ